MAADVELNPLKKTGAHIPYLRRLNRLHLERSTYIGHYRELSENIHPRRSRFDPSDRWRAGSKKNDKIWNNTATRALRIMASGMQAGITSPARPWFRLRLSTPELNSLPEVKAWLAEVEQILLEVFARSNIYNALPVAYEDLGCYGTSCVFIEPNDEDVLRAHVLPVGSYYIALNEAYQVNAVYRETTLTVEQLVRRFGLDNCSEHIKTLWKQKMFDEWIEVVQVVEPNDLQKPGMLGPSGMPTRSVWFEWGGRGAWSTNDNYTGQGPQQLLGLGGFNEFPCLVPRWAVTGEDAYGSSPGMDALGDIKGLQHIERRLGNIWDKLVNPPMQGPAALRHERTSLLAGDLTIVETQSGQKFEPAVTIDPRALLVKDEILRHQDRISGAFYADLFLMLANSGVNNMTAREVEERHEEKMLQLGPVLERLHDELLDPLINRAFGICQRKGMIPPPPPSIQGVDFRPEYISVLAQAQKLILTVGVERLVGFVNSMAETKPEVLDKLDVDAIVDEYADLLGVKPDLVIPTKEVKAMREKQQAMLNEQQAKMARDAAAATKDLSAAPVGGEGGGSALDAMLKGMGPAATGAPIPEA